MLAYANGGAKQADNVVVRGGHVSLLCSASAQRAVAAALARTGERPAPVAGVAA